MPTRQEREEQKTREIERITNRVRDTADRLFDGKVPQGFLYWAADLHLDQTENPPQRTTCWLTSQMARMTSNLTLTTSMTVPGRYTSSNQNIAQVRATFR